MNSFNKITSNISAKTEVVKVPDLFNAHIQSGYFSSTFFDNTEMLKNDFLDHDSNAMDSDFYLFFWYRSFFTMFITLFVALSGDTKLEQD